MTTRPDGTEIRIWARPRASRTAVTGVHGDALALALAAPPVDGAANDEVIAFLARQLGVSRSAITLLSGHKGRSKRVFVAGASADSVLALLPTA